MDQSAVWPIVPSWFSYMYVFLACFTCRMHGSICGDCLEFGLVSCLSGGVVLEISGSCGNILLESTRFKD
jgi:hypothetical protein